MDRCVRCDGVVKVNYSCYDLGGADIYICNDCESHYGYDVIVDEILSDN